MQKRAGEGPRASLSSGVMRLVSEVISAAQSRPWLTPVLAADPGLGVLADAYPDARLDRPQSTGFQAPACGP